MNNKSLLVTGITLLYRESQMPDCHENSSGLVRQIISNIKLPDATVGLDQEREILGGLKSTALYMCDAPKNHQYEPIEFMQRIRLNTLEDNDLYQTIGDGVLTPLEPEVLKRVCLNLRRTLSEHFREEKVHEIMNQASYKLKFERSKIENMAQFVSETVSALEPYMVSSHVQDPAILSEVDIGDLNAVAKVFAEVKNESEGIGILRCGFQGVNRMLDNGFRRGEQVVIGALQHQYKTGFSLTVFKQICLYNIPLLKDPSKKPLLMHVSFEDTTLKTFEFLYTSLYENETGQKADPSLLTEDELAQYVYSKLGETGFTVKFLYVNPSMWTYRDICNKVLEYEAQGYEVQLCCLDYLLKVPTTGCTRNASGDDIRNMYERVQAFMKSKGIIMITPHQLSPDAKRMMRDGRQDFVKELPGKGYYDGCTKLDQVVDVEIFIHIEIVNGKSYLTIQRGKHRKNRQTPHRELYAVLPFEEIGALRDDVNGEDTTRRKVGGGAVGSGDEVPFWSTI
jgi:hypothetical protein